MKKKPAYVVAKEKANAYLAKHPDATVKEACKKTGVRLSNYYFNPALVKARLARKKSVKRKARKQIKQMVEELPQQNPTVVAVIGDPNAISQTINKIFN